MSGFISIPARATCACSTYSKPPTATSPPTLYDFKDLNLTLDLNPRNQPHYLAGGETTNNSYSVATNDTLSLYQDAGGDNEWANENTWQGVPVNTFRGYRLMNGATQVESGNYPQGWAGLEGGNGGVFVMVRISSISGVLGGN